MGILRRQNKDITIIIIHCSASDKPEHDSIDVIRQWHLDRGFDDVGYHFFIKKNGDVERGRKLFQIGAHCKGFNSESVGICLAGNHDFSDCQFKSAAKLIDGLKEILPNLKSNCIFPHFLFDINKTCPNFLISEITKYSKLVF